MNSTVFLTMGLAGALLGGWIALNVRGSAASPERRSDANAELRMHAQGDLGPAQRRMSARLIRLFGAVIGLSGMRAHAGWAAGARRLTSRQVAGPPRPTPAPHVTRSAPQRGPA